MHHAGTNLRSTARVEPPPPLASRRRPTACVTPPGSRGRQLASRRRLTACVTSPGRRPPAWRRLKMSSSSDGKFSCSCSALGSCYALGSLLLLCLAHCSADFDAQRQRIWSVGQEYGVLDSSNIKSHKCHQSTKLTIIVVFLLAI